MDKGGQILSTKPQRPLRATGGDADLHDSGGSGQVKSVQDSGGLGHVKLELGRPDSPRCSTPPGTSDSSKSGASLEEARKLRQAQQKLRKEEWRKKYGGMTSGGGVAQEVESIPDADLLAEMEKCEMELISNGKYLPPPSPQSL